MLKRCLDLLLASVLLILTAPVEALAVVLVAIDLGRPVMFSQMRAGRDGSVFRLFKLRTMRPQPDDGRTLSDAERVTALGLTLRRFRLDELPQVFLILRGDMSFVGPRPLHPQGHAPENDHLFRYRHRVRPGMTGWAQVNGNTLLAEREKLALDAVYVSRAATLFDLWVLLLTLVTIIGGERRNEQNIREALLHADCIDRRG